jgi:hypothetical protein
MVFESGAEPDWVGSGALGRVAEPDWVGSGAPGRVAEPDSVGSGARSRVADPDWVGSGARSRVAEPDWVGSGALSRDRPAGAAGRGWVGSAGALGHAVWAGRMVECDHLNCPVRPSFVADFGPVWVVASRAQVGWPGR